MKKRKIGKKKSRNYTADSKLLINYTDSSLRKNKNEFINSILHISLLINNSYK